MTRNEEMLKHVNKTFFKLNDITIVTDLNLKRIHFQSNDPYCWLEADCENMNFESLYGWLKSLYLKIESKKIENEDK